MVFYKIPLFTIMALWICSTVLAQKPLANQDEFLFAVVELHQLEDSNDFEVEFKATQIIVKKLRIPTKSEGIPNENDNYVRFQITDEAQNPLDEIIINDPFNVSYEYVDEDGNLKQTRVAQKSRSILIRRPISATATNLTVQPGDQRDPE